MKHHGGGPVARRVAIVCTALVAVLFGTAGIVTGDLGTTLIGVGFVVVMVVLSVPGLRWLRRGDGPHATRSAADEDRETYVHLRHTGGNSNGR
ncbi:hypothetical protein KC207_02885 [Phycicoccus sp. BSK3Z-2]|uniref:Uncharacterized protein n=1 Tax=Phycicoccus avicenniae TaxID=2828860 RepID=A0A941D518_9MICO|nr:hypothetical protein [Phycicoccus avicenniae]MBR7742239.1 hypothetical protein [Phycicoccus avicenniae]